ncbi:MAG: sugar phosphate nucleotidyltransferase [Dictyoglomus sp.]|nr:sugar phosphate nucleotidyltransferase [Dictyoglomus sp.]MCX7942849.1 sugar phosphate nucleotidyltransferase [Dictyoglomaceae bacterium]MDW8188343.1 sugar phosphate nucleotidyltransferase [Dictyoglomus sp.]
MKDWVAVILSAGQGKRMKTERPKVLHLILDRPIIYYLTDLVSRIVKERYFIVVSPKLYKILYKEYEDHLVIQERPLGTGDAVRQLIPFLKEFKGNILILPGDVPLIKEETLKLLCEIHEKNNNVCTLLTTYIENPKGYGRIVRDVNGNILKIVEEKDATEEEKKIKEVNASIYAFSWESLKEVLPYLSNNNTQKEFYLTDTISLLLEKGKKIETLRTEPYEVMGINNQLELADIQRVLQEAINRKWMEEGVSFISPNLTFIGKYAILNKDVIIYPCTFIFGQSYLEKGAKISSNVMIEDYYIGEDVEIGSFSFISSKLRIKGD